MIYLLDANILSGLSRRQPNIVMRLAGIGALDEAVTCTIVKGESLFGIAKMDAGKRRDEVQRLVLNALRDVRSITVPDSAAEVYASIKRARQIRGLPVAENDLWIAATAIATGSVLVSHDTDVRGIPGLLLEDWW